MMFSTNVLSAIQRDQTYQFNKITIHSSTWYLKWSSLMDIWFILLLVCYVTTTCRVRFTTNVTTTLMSNKCSLTNTCYDQNDRMCEKLVETNHVYFTRWKFVLKWQKMYMSAFEEHEEWGLKYILLHFIHTCL